MATRTFTAADCTKAARRCSELAQQRPSWPQARVRATVAKELQLATVQLRYLLRQAEGRSEAPVPDTDALALAT